MSQTGGYAMTAVVDDGFANVVEKVRAALAEEGFGVLSEIDVQAALREKLGEEREPYLILGACNPRLASRGIDAEPDLGVLLPCNVVVRADSGSAVRVAAMEPLFALGLAANPALEPLAREARERLERTLGALGAEPTATPIAGTS
jgi:uncharacterized protein (DUF302 family)